MVSTQAYNMNYDCEETQAITNLDVDSLGLSLTLFINQLEYIGSLSQDAGVRVLIHRADLYPFMEDDGFNTGPGTLTSVKLTFVSNIVYYCISGSVVECSPVMQAARVRFPADVDIYEHRLWREVPNARPSQPRSPLPSHG